MARITANTLRIRNNSSGTSPLSFKMLKSSYENIFISRNTKLLAWVIFLILFIENGTLGLLPRQYYFVYRSVRISDLLMYAVIIYSLFCIKEYQDIFRSRALFIVKIILLYMMMRFLASVLVYEVNLLEYFFRLKMLWSSFMLFPFILLIQRNGLGYFIKIMFPVAVVSNILYILTALTGTPFLPEVSIYTAKLPGGIEVYRVFGGTFYGDVYFLGFIYFWISKKFKLWQLFFAVIFIIPHILAFGRGAWIFFTFTITFMLMWNSFMTKNLKIFAKQTAIIVLLSVVLIYTFISIVPQSEYYLEAVNARVKQGVEDIKYEEGTYGTRMANNELLMNLWLKSNVLFGIGMHPLWVIDAVTHEEALYKWGFSDLRWTGVLAAYGLIGFLLAVIFQIYYLFTSFKILKISPKTDLLTFFVTLLSATMLFDTIVNYTYNLISVSLWAFSYHISFYLACISCKYENLAPNDESALNTKIQFNNNKLRRHFFTKTPKKIPPRPSQ